MKYKIGSGYIFFYNDGENKEISFGKCTKIVGESFSPRYYFDLFFIHKDNIEYSQTSFVFTPRYTTIKVATKRNLKILFKSLFSDSNVYTFGISHE